MDRYVPPAAAPAATKAPAPARCVARSGTGRVYLHPEGECACFRGGPTPIQQPTSLDRHLATIPSSAGRPLTGVPSA